MTASPEVARYLFAYERALSNENSCSELSVWPKMSMSQLVSCEAGLGPSTLLVDFITRFPCIDTQPENMFVLTSHAGYSHWVLQALWSSSCHAEQRCSMVLVTRSKTHRRSSVPTAQEHPESRSWKISQITLLRFAQRTSRILYDFRSSPEPCKTFRLWNRKMV